MKISILTFIFFLSIFCICECTEMSNEEMSDVLKSKSLTYGSSLRFQNVLTEYYMTSFNMNWSTGSKLQVITAIRSDSDSDSLFLIKEADGYFPRSTGTPVKCGDMIRLEHVNTGKNLHSHELPSFVTNSQEACAFGENGVGDVNDNIIIQCYKQKDGEIIKGDSQFFFKHNATQKYAYINYKTSMFNDRNCRGCPIRGQREVSFTEKKDKQCLWRMNGGLLFEENKGEEDNNNSNNNNSNNNSSSNNENKKNKKENNYDL